MASIYERDLRRGAPLRGSDLPLSANPQVPRFAGDTAGAVRLPSGEEAAWREKKAIFRKAGGNIREANLDLDAGGVIALLLQDSTVEHLAIDPEKYKENGESQLRKDFEGRDAHLFVATLPGRGVVGTVAVVKDQKELRGARLVKLAVGEGYRGLGISYHLIRKALALAYTPEEKGGLGCEDVSLGIIKIGEYGRTRDIFEGKWGFESLGVHEKHCDSWSIREGAMRARDVLRMHLQRRKWVFKYGGDLGRNLPAPVPAI